MSPEERRNHTEMDIALFSKESTEIGNNITLFREPAYHLSLPQETRKAILNLALTRFAENTKNLSSTSTDLEQFLRVVNENRLELQPNTKFELVTNIKKILSDLKAKGKTALKFKTSVTSFIQYLLPVELRICPFFHCSDLGNGALKIEEFVNDPIKREKALATWSMDYCSQVLKPGQFLLRPSSSDTIMPDKYTFTLTLKTRKGEMWHSRVAYETTDGQSLWKYGDESFKTSADFIACIAKKTRCKGLPCATNLTPPSELTSILESIHGQSFTPK